MMNILVANVGSTSYKFKLIDMKGEGVLASGKFERVGSPAAAFYCRASGGPQESGQVPNCSYADCISKSLEFIASIPDASGGIQAVGFKTVHAGPFTGSFLIDETVMAAMEEFRETVPAHNPPYISAIRLFQRILPGKPLVAVFETGFHRDIPDYARVYGVPLEWAQRHGIRKYGFHGSSHRYISRRAPELLSRPAAELKIISCHLGGSSSICAIQGGVSVDNSMGFSAQAGLPMSNRVGDVDVFAVLHVMEKENLSISRTRDILTKNSGLKGISGQTGDLKEILELADEGDERARLALRHFVYKSKQYIGAYAAILGGLDVLAFTGGIGENSPPVRRMICEGLDFLGIAIDEGKNGVSGAEAVISRDGSAVKVMVVPADEELVVARETARVIMENN